MSASEKDFFDPANPFRYREKFGDGWYTLHANVVECRLDLLDQLNKEQLRAALTVPDLQKAVQVAIERRLRKIAKDETQAAAQCLIRRTAQKAREERLKAKMLEATHQVVEELAAEQRLRRFEQEDR